VKDVTLNMSTNQSEWVRALTMHLTYVHTVFNLTFPTMRGGKRFKDMTKTQIAMNGVWLLAITPLLEAQVNFLRDALRESDEDDLDEMLTPEGYAKHVAGSTFRGAIGPVFGPIAPVAESLGAAVIPDFKAFGASVPALDFLADVGWGVKSAGDALAAVSEGDEWEEDAMKTILYAARASARWIGIPFSNEAIRAAKRATIEE